MSHNNETQRVRQQLHDEIAAYDDLVVVEISKLSAGTTCWTTFQRAGVPSYTSTQLKMS